MPKIPKGNRMSHIPAHLSLTHWLGQTTAVVQLEADLRQRYAEPGRAYHNLTHLAHALAVAHSLIDYTNYFTAVGLALWFHDAVYDPQAPAGQNEQDSATLAVSRLTALGHPPTLVQQVHELVLVTQTHQPHTTEGRVVVDADLAILAAPSAQYDDYAQAIRQEYSWVADEAYRVGRTAVLQRFLARPHIFHTPPLQGKEALARANLQRELSNYLSP